MTNNKPQTAVEQFAEQLAIKNLLGIYTHDEMVMFEDLLNQFKEMEKEQIEDAYWEGGIDVPMNREQCQQYYNETYRSNETIQ